MDKGKEGQTGGWMDRWTDGQQRPINMPKGAQACLVMQQASDFVVSLFLTQSPPVWQVRLLYRVH